MVAELLPEIVAIEGPEIWLHEYDFILPSGSVPDPVIVKDCTDETVVISLPAFAVGAMLTGDEESFTVI
jgi:hypothetical protein